MPKRTLSTSRNGDFARLDARDTDGDELIVRLFHPTSYTSITVKTGEMLNVVELDMTQASRLRDFLNEELPK